MKYNISIKNVQVQSVASVEEANVSVEYGVGEIPEILSHLLPFVERLTGEIAPKLANTFVDARLRLQKEEEAIRRERAEAEVSSINKMGEILKELGSSNPKHQEETDELPEGASLEQLIEGYRRRYMHG